MPPHPPETAAPATARHASAGKMPQGQNRAARLPPRKAPAESPGVEASVAVARSTPRPPPLLRLLHHRPWALCAVVKGRGQLHGHRQPFMTVPRSEPALPPPCGGSAFAHGDRSSFCTVRHEKVTLRETPGGGGGGGCGCGCGCCCCCCFPRLFRNECVCPQTPGLIGKGAQHLGLTRRRRHLPPGPCV